jgi:hypothetical protein
MVACEQVSKSVCSQLSMLNDIRVMQNPYPKTQHCEVPNDAAAKVELELCRPLPLEYFPEVPRAQPVPVIAPIGMLFAGCM